MRLPLLFPRAYLQKSLSSCATSPPIPDHGVGIAQGPISHLPFLPPFPHIDKVVCWKIQSVSLNSESIASFGIIQKLKKSPRRNRMVKHTSRSSQKMAHKMIHRLAPSVRSDLAVVTPCFEIPCSQKKARSLMFQRSRILTR